MNKYQIQRLPLTMAIGSVLAASTAQAATISVDSLQDGALGTITDACTLRAAIASANTGSAVDGCSAGSSGADIIEFEPDLNFSIITLSAGQLEITSPITLRGPVAGDALGLIIDAEFNSRILRISGATPGAFEVGLENLTLTRGISYFGPQKYGAGILATAVDLTLTDVMLANNVVYGDGGAGLRFADGALSMNRVVLTENAGIDSDNGGGGLWASNAQVTISHSDVLDNSIADRGAGILVENCNTLIEHSTISGNQTSRHIQAQGGGGIRAEDGLLVVTHSSIETNRIDRYGSGGGISSQGADLFVYASQVIGNYISYNYNFDRGAGIQLRNANSIIAHSLIANNGFSGPYTSGGGAYLNGDQHSLIATRVIENSSSAYGGGLHIRGNANILYSEIVGNISGSGAGLHHSQGNLLIANTTISGNAHFSNEYGSGSITTFSTQVVQLLHSSIVTNAPQNGTGTAAIYSSSGVQLELIGTTISGSNAVPLCNRAPSLVVNSLGTDPTCTPVVVSLVNLAQEPLAFNGGPTRTHALGPTSAAINNSGNCADFQVLYDQRGRRRPGIGGSACDTGAFEFSDEILRDRFEPGPF